MPSSKVPVTFTFHRKAARPPVFVAGSFSDPPWQPLEMDASIDQHGDLIFTKQVMVDELSEVQYKFRHASGDWWALDPDAETVTDEHGNVNSLLRCPTKLATQQTTLGKDVRAIKVQETAAADVVVMPNESESELATDADTREFEFPKKVAENDKLRRLSFTPIEEVANTAAEVADSALKLDDDGLNNDDLPVDSSDTLPMFSHETFAPPPDSQTSGHQDAEHNLEPNWQSGHQVEIDHDDPRLERFPSDRDSIFATVRRLSTAIDADAALGDAFPPLPIPQMWSMPNAGVKEANTAHDEVPRSPLSLAVPRNSLQSIAEGEEASEGTAAPNVADDSNTSTQYVGPVPRRNTSLASTGSSNADEGISMGSVSPTCTTRAPRIKKAGAKAHAAPAMDEAIPNEALPGEEHANEQPDLRRASNAYVSHGHPEREP
ncbi:hypothetical protein F4802DRAFT_548160 [Xylaria palmicola]|nr:hypothetical protein F4802DRAFT_548160 [Xylaria palmicola]